MAKQLPDSAALKELFGGGVAGVLVARGTGTTSGTINTANLVTHGAKDKDGNAFPAANLFVLVVPTMAGNPPYQSAAPTATQIDIRSATASLTYNWYLFVCN